MDILVATSADFARLRDGRPVASGTWDAVVRATLTADGAPPFGTRVLTLALRDGTAFRAADDAPGWDDLVEAAEGALPGMRPRRAWDTDAGDAGGDGVVLFDRDA